LVLTASSRSYTTSQNSLIANKVDKDLGSVFDFHFQQFKSEAALSKSAESLSYKPSLGLESDSLHSVNNYYCWCLLFLLWQFLGAS